MTGLFDWLAKFLDFFWQFVPRPTTVEPFRKAVRVRTVLVRDLFKFKWDPSAKVTILDPGFHVFWPFTTTWTEYPVKEQTLPVISVQFETAEKDGVKSEVLSASAILKYEVDDLQQLYCENYDADDGISDVAQTVLLRVLAGMSKAEIRRGITFRRTLDTKLKNEAEEDLKQQYGVRVKKFSLNSLTPIRVFRVIQSTRQEGELK